MRFFDGFIGVHVSFGFCTARSITLYMFVGLSTFRRLLALLVLLGDAFICWRLLSCLALFALLSSLL
jgi:hypothetical protein